MSLYLDGDLPHEDLYPCLSCWPSGQATPSPSCPTSFLPSFLCQYDHFPIVLKSGPHNDLQPHTKSITILDNSSIHMDNPFKTQASQLLDDFIFRDLPLCSTPAAPPHPLAQKLFWMLQNPNSLTSDIFPRFLFLWHSPSLVFTRSPSSLSLLLPVLYYTCRCQQAPSHRKKAAMWVIQVIDLCVCFNHLTADGNQMSSGRNAFLIILRGHGPAASLLSDKGSISFGVG